MFNSTQVPVAYPVATPVSRENSPSPPISIRLFLSDGYTETYIEIGRSRPNKPDFRAYKNPSPASIKRIAKLADKASLFNAWFIIPRPNGWMAIERKNNNV